MQGIVHRQVSGRSVAKMTSLVQTSDNRSGRGRIGVGNSEVEPDNPAEDHDAYARWVDRCDYSVHVSCDLVDPARLEDIAAHS